MQSVSTCKRAPSPPTASAAVLTLALALTGCGGGQGEAAPAAGSAPSTATAAAGSAASATAARTATAAASVPGAVQVPTGEDGLETPEGDPDGTPSGPDVGGPPQPGILARQLTWKSGPPKSTGRWWSPGNEESVECTGDAVKVVVEQDNKEQVTFEARSDGTASVSSPKQRADLTAQVQWGAQARIIQAADDTAVWTYEDGEIGAGLLIETTVICGRSGYSSGSPSPS